MLNLQVNYSGQSQRCGFRQLHGPPKAPFESVDSMISAALSIGIIIA